MRYDLRALLIVLAFLPPLVAGGWWYYAAWKVEQQRPLLFRDLVETIQLPRLPTHFTESSEFYAALLQMAPIAGGVVSAALFVAVVMVAASLRKPG
jgi:hypothetical protein